MDLVFFYELRTLSTFLRVNMFDYLKKMHCRGADNRAHENLRTDVSYHVCGTPRSVFVTQ